ncbi:unnamed protein product [Rotaria sordida]|uniref:acid phosphatase n=2 Tax=Rotaria sordida TaxID=392033 RepID=A0A819D5Q2_9BILA|nr:unnamed protein product [Rotaria sordida]CAF3832722.1 unnamed protein product [Rotaria sordida]
MKCSEEKTILVGTHIIYRHGDRSPILSYPESIVDEFFWPNGFGQLTLRGQLQQIRLGQYFRERYSELLNSTYVASEVTIRSTDNDRTLMSAYSNLLGLYPTSKEKLDLILLEIEQDNKWPEVLPWQPIPVHTVPKSIDYLMGVSECPYFFELVEEIRNTEQIQNISRDFRNFFDKLEIWTGTKINDLFDAWLVADIIIIEALYNKTSSWANAFVLSQLRQIADLSLYYVFNSFKTNRIIAGPMIGDIMENIQNLMSSKSNGWKAKIYSAHDATVVAILSYFQANYIHQPSYGSTLFFDLYHIPENNTYFLQVEYLNSTNSRTPHPIKLLPCSNVMCPIEILNRWLENRLPSKDMKTECMPRRSHPSLAS